MGAAQAYAKVNRGPDTDREPDKDRGMDDTAAQLFKKKKKKNPPGEASLPQAGCAHWAEAGCLWTWAALQKVLASIPV